MSEDCRRKGRWFGGCRFEPRYDLSPADMTGFQAQNIGQQTVLGLVEKHRKKTYVRDVCVTCGKVIAR